MCNKFNCANCKYCDWSYLVSSHICFNPFSDCCRDLVDEHFFCDKFEEKKGDEDYLSKIKALKVGDTITIEHFDGSTSTSIVTKLTEKGEIITDNGRFRFHSANGRYKQYGTFSVIKF